MSRQSEYLMVALASCSIVLGVFLIFRGDTLKLDFNFEVSLSLGTSMESPSKPNKSSPVNNRIVHLDPGITVLKPRITVVDHSPQEGVKNVQPDTELSVSFSCRINMNSVHQDSFSVIGEFSGTMLGSFSQDETGRTVTFSPGKEFEPGELVTIRLSSSIRSTAGTSLDAFSFGFTVDPIATEPEPVDRYLEPELPPITFLFTGRGGRG